MSIRTLLGLHTPQPTLCEECGHLWHPKAMNWNTIGLYRCRRCNPDPGPPTQTMSPQQLVRAKRYARVIENTAPAGRCTECGCKLRKIVWHPLTWCDNAESVHHGVQLCGDCVGPDPFDHGWMAMQIVWY